MCNACPVASVPLRIAAIATPHPQTTGMTFSDEIDHLRINLDTKNCQLSAAEIGKLESGLAPLRRPVRQFPVADLYITIDHHARSNDYHVKLSLVLSGRTLFTGDRQSHHYPAFERCVHKLVNQLEWYKQNLGARDELAKHRKGTHQEVLPTQEPAGDLLEEAVGAGDYVRFRVETFVYEEPIRKRVGRWIERYPELEALMLREVTIEDVVEEVFLTAFDRWNERPDEVRFGDWLDGLIDPAVKMLLRNRDEELENIRFARTLHETQTPPRPPAD
jgi:ribosome-associated translation inhibitor RaiA